jgi:pyruvate dehydrogenase E2 component (dihydrolipoamide acetyltransferase)
MTEVKLPPIGEGIAEGEIIKWHVQPGDTVAAEQTLVEVLTDKASVEIPSPAAGVVEALMAKEGDLVPVGHTIVKLGTGAAPVAEAPAAANGHEPATALPVDAPRPTVLEAISQTILATPSIRQFAREQGIDLNRVPGSGPYGRITREDVVAVGAVGGPKYVAPPGDGCHPDRGHRRAHSSARHSSQDCPANGQSQIYGSRLLLCR